MGKGIPTDHVEVGAVGTVVEAYPRDAALSACLVEFGDGHGCGYAFATVPVEALTKAQGKLGKTIDRALERVMAALIAYAWPGNIRQLANVGVNG